MAGGCVQTRLWSRRVRRLDSILVVVERRDMAHQALLKGYVLARHFGASLELFHCDVEHALALRHSYDPRGIESARAACLADARRFLEALRCSVAAEDVPIALDVACESPLYEGIVHKVLSSCPSLVIKAVGVDNGHRGTFSASDSQLARTCPVPLMLTRGRAWSATPRFLAAVDLSAAERPGMARMIAETAGYLGAGCRAAIDLVYCAPPGAGSPPGATDAAQSLTQLAREAGATPEAVHLLEGEPEEMLPRFVREHDYDLVLLGALTHRHSYSSLVGSLTSRLVDSLACDFVLIKPGSYVCPLDIGARGVQSS